MDIFGGIICAILPAFKIPKYETINSKEFSSIKLTTEFLGYCKIFVDTDDDKPSISLYEYSSSFEITAVFFELSCTEFCNNSGIVFMSVIQQILTDHLHT